MPGPQRFASGPIFPVKKPKRTKRSKYSTLVLCPKMCRGKRA